VVALVAEPLEETSTPKLAWRWTVAYVLVLLMIVIFAGLGRLGGVLNTIHAIPLGDKLAHFLLVGSLAYVVNISLRGSGVQLFGVRILYGGLLIFWVMTLEEISQHWLTSRRFDLGDMLANTLGVLVFSYLAARQFKNVNS
jgi:VanZ family protein